LVKESINIYNNMRPHLSLMMKTPLVKESINIYNNMRPHLSLMMKTPNEVHEKSQQLALLA
ncbi:hypothetical protein L1D20_21270, partial [Vibrio chagasii]|nr:hypothetical protein [Vibrio chagasii]